MPEVEIETRDSVVTGESKPHVVMSLEYLAELLQEYEGAIHSRGVSAVLAHVCHEAASHSNGPGLALSMAEIFELA